MLIINGSGFLAGGTDAADTAARLLFARETLEAVITPSLCATFAGCPETPCNVHRAQWACPYVAKHYHVESAELFAEWIRTSGPLAAQILLHA